jgi:hypothetical protein
LILRIPSEWEAPETPEWKITCVTIHRGKRGAPNEFPSIDSCVFHPRAFPKQTDVSVASECKRKTAQAQTQIEITVVLAWIMIGLVMLVLLFADQSFSRATIELMCLFYS